MSGMISRPAPLPQRWSAGLNDYIIATEWSPDERLIAVASVSGELCLLNAETGAQHPLQGHAQGINALSFHRDGKILASAGSDGKIKLWDVNRRELLREMPGGSAWVEHLSFSRDGKYLAAASGKRLKIFSADGALLREFSGFEGSVSGLCWRPQNVGVLLAISYGAVSFIQVTSDKIEQTLPWKGSLLALSLSPDGRYLATGSQDALVQFWDLKRGIRLQMYGYETKIRELSWDSSSRYLATGGGSTISIWDCSGQGPAGREPKVLRWHQGSIRQLHYQSSGHRLLSLSMDGRIAVWAPNRAEIPSSGSEMGQGVSCARWSPSEKKIAAGGEAGAVWLFEPPRE